MASGPRGAFKDFEAFFLKAPVALGVIAGNGEMTMVNGRFRTEFGYLPEDLPDLDSWWRLAYPDPEYRKQVISSWSAAVESALSSGSEVAAAEYRVRRKDGSTGTYIIGGAIMGDHTIASFIDVSARKAAEEGHADILERYRALTETATTGIWQLDDRGRTIYCNSAMRSMLGLGADEKVEGIPFGHFYAPESRELAMAEHLKRRRGLSSTFEAKLLDGRGGKRDVIVTGVPILREDGGMKGIVATFVDITERVRAEEEAKRGEENLRTIIDAAPYSIAINDCATREYLDGNKTLLKAFGLSDVSELRGKRPTDFIRMASDELEAALDANLRDGKVLDKFTTEFRDASGKTRYAMLSTRPIPYQGKDAHVTILVDITELKEAEAELLLLNAELESKVAERTEDLAHSNLELQAANRELAKALEGMREAQRQMVLSEKLAALGRLMAGIYHGLSSPLSVIEAVSRIELHSLGEGLDGLALAVSRLGPEELAFLREARARSVDEGPESLRADPAAERKAKREVEATLAVAGVPDPTSVADDLVELGLACMAERAAPLIAGAAGGDLMALFRGAVGPYRAARLAEEAVGKASRVIAALRTYARGGDDEAPARFRLEPELRGILDLYGDRVKRGLVLVLEADKGLEAFGRREALSRVWLNIVDNAVQAAGERGKVEVSARAEGSSVLVSVADTGPGIAPDIAEHIFEPFFTTKPAGEGTGLGLDVARRLVREEGGDIGFESRPGRTIFYVRLPSGGSGEKGDLQ